MSESTANPATPAPAKGSHSSTAWVSVLMLTLVTLLTFSNSITEQTVFDDKVFAGPDRLRQIEHLGDAFKEGIWGNEAGDGKGLYRPLLLINFELENRLFGSWTKGFHLVNVLLHLAASLALYGLLQNLLSRTGATRETVRLSALLAALVFAVHPVHTEVVNSIFNRSSIYVALFAAAGLWWLFAHLDSKPAKAWIGLGVAYTIGIFLKESALVIPGIAVALIVILTPGSLLERVRRFLPVFWLLIPIALYFYLRSSALAQAATTGLASVEPGAEFAIMLDATRLPGQDTLLSALGVLGGGLKLILWPYPLRLFYSTPADAVIVVMVIGQVLAIAAAVFLFFRGRPGLAAGLSFYYVAMLPASRLISMDGAGPHLADRYLYFPSVGLTLTLAYVLVALLRRFGRRSVILPTFGLVLLLAAMSWERNHEWGSELFLFETEYSRGYRGSIGLRVLVGSHADQGHYKRVLEICDENPDWLGYASTFTMICGFNYARFDRVDDAIHAFEREATLDRDWIKARLAMAKVYFSQGQLQEGANQYATIINKLDDPALKEMYKGLVLLELYPRNRGKLNEAKGHFEKAMQLDPDIDKAQDWVDHLESMLDPANIEPATETDPGSQ
ncbi:MAG: tetratricopeptide repeat protein [Xanthomonadales bacterium]|nr:tetratricopeptide repeat protein [Xanthomonadales bacterium]